MQEKTRITTSTGQVLVPSAAIRQVNRHLKSVFSFHAIKYRSLQPVLLLQKILSNTGEITKEH
jgi:hypothetical protein